MNTLRYLLSNRTPLLCLVLLLFLPIATLAILGLIWLWQQDLLLFFSLTWLLAGVAAYGWFVVLPDTDDKPAEASSTQSLPHDLTAKSDWTAIDLQAWQTSCVHIETQLNRGLSWNAIQSSLIDLLSVVAGHYHADAQHAKLRFTLPEALLILSVASTRYRTLVIQHVPFADNITVATLTSLYERQEQFEKGYRWFNRARRTVRLLNPLSAVIGEAREYMTSSMLAKVSDTLQTDLKRLLLQEIAQTAIDLYSGRLKVSEQELSGYQSASTTTDQKILAEATEPLRTVIVGQVNAGKSALINSFHLESTAESDLLPATETDTVYPHELTEGRAIHFIDTRGLDAQSTDQSDNLDALIETAVNADMIIHLCKATQPAREPDRLFREQLDNWFTARPQRKRPPMIMVISHSDQIPHPDKPQPWPQAITELSNDHQLTINQASASIINQIGYPVNTPAIPVGFSEGVTHFNVDALKVEIEALVTSATQTQLNRRRSELASSAGDWRNRLRQTKGLAKTLGRSLNRKRQN